jgi:uncharacterized protein
MTQSKDAAQRVEHLTTTECWRLLESTSPGRLAVEGAEGVPEVFPVNFTVHSGSVYFRSAPGSKLMDIAARPAVAFEIDGEDPLSYWSVILKGTARRLDSDAEIHESGVDKLASASPTPKHDFVRITPASVTGRRFRRGATASADAVGGRAATTTGAHEPARPPAEDEGWPGSGRPPTRPIPIPHFPPRPTH